LTFGAGDLDVLTQFCFKKSKHDKFFLNKNLFKCNCTYKEQLKLASLLVQLVISDYCRGDETATFQIYALSGL
jgi:hypothetical protein